MTLTINREIYSQLLSTYQPRIIKTEEENEQFLEIVEELLARNDLTPEEDTLLELLVKLIEGGNRRTHGCQYLSVKDSRGV
jgi:HTH-type transcriptional regulator / antitoxin HigA